MATGKPLQAVVEIAGTLSPTLQKSIEDAAGKLDGLNVKALAIGATVGVSALAVGKAVIEAGEYLADLGDEYNQAMNDLSAATGATGEDLEALGDVVKTVYGDNFGDSMGDAAAAVSDVKTVLDLTGDALAQATEDAIALSDTFDYEVGESARTASALMKNFGIDAEEAYNIIAYGAQNGADQNGDLLDTLNEYSAQYDALGLSADQFVQGLVNAGDMGVFSIDKVGDAVKEFNIRSKDLSESSAEAYATLGLNADEMFAAFAAGGDEANAAFFDVLDALQALDDPLAKNSAAVALFGTMYEDLGEDILPILSSMEDATLDNIDVLEQINDIKYDDIGAAMEGIKRQAEVALLPLATTVANTLMDVAPMIGDMLEGILPAIEEMTDALIPIIEGLLPVAVEIINELAPVIEMLADVLFTELIPPVVEIMASLLPVAIELLKMFIPILTTVIAEILPVVVKLVQKLLPVLLKIVSAVLPVITSLLETLLPLLGEIIDAVLPVVLELIDALLPLFMTIVDAVLPVIVDLLNTLTPILMDIISAVLPVVVQLIEALVPIITQLIEAVLPILIEVLNLLTPILDLIIQLLTPILDLFMTLLQPVLDLIFMALTPLIEVVGLLISSALEPVLPILTLVAEAITTVLGGAIEGIKPVIESLMTVFQGLIDFITGIFTGDWSKAWSGVVDVFGGLWDTLVGLVKLPINAVIGLVNKAIGGLNSISCTIPEWVPFVGGQTFGINIPTIPMLATGGFTEGITIAGEAGTEAVISFDPAYHERNVEIWREAGQMLGAEPTYTAQAGKLLELDDFSLTEMADGGTYVVYYDFSGFTWSPQVDGSGGDSDDVMTRLKEHEAEFFDWLEEFVRMREVSCFG